MKLMEARRSAAATHHAEAGQTEHAGVLLANRAALEEAAEVTDAVVADGTVLARALRPVQVGKHRIAVGQLRVGPAGDRAVSAAEAVEERAVALQADRLLGLGVGDEAELPDGTFTVASIEPWE